MNPDTCHPKQGVNQWCPLSGILFQFYNTDLIDSYDPKEGETTVAFMDNALMLVCAKTMEEVYERLVDMMTWPGGSLEWFFYFLFYFYLYIYCIHCLLGLHPISDITY